MIIGIPVYDGVDLLDVAGPHEIFGWMDPKVDLRVVAASKKPISTRDNLGLIPSHTFDETPALDVLWVPGGDPPALKQLMSGPDRTYLDFLISRSAKATYVCSVCEGALLLAKAGLLDGYRSYTTLKGEGYDIDVLLSPERWRDAPPPVAEPVGKPAP